MFTPPLHSYSFPFLIGTVRTNEEQPSHFVCDVFPFLIGTVRTFDDMTVSYYDDKFPFLIGTVRTLVWIVN